MSFWENIFFLLQHSLIIFPPGLWIFISRWKTEKQPQDSKRAASYFKDFYQSFLPTIICNSDVYNDKTYSLCYVQNTSRRPENKQHPLSSYNNLAGIKPCKIFPKVNEMGSNDIQVTYSGC